MTELNHTKENCTANDICLGGPHGTFCGNCLADGSIVKVALRAYECTGCGHQIETKTNHRGEIYPTCTGKCRQIINPHTEREQVLQTQTAHKFVKDLQ